MTTRPPAPGKEIPGCHWEVRPAANWRLDPGRKCRTSVAHPCGKPSAAALARTYHRTGKPDSTVWWAYCEDHMYGRWIEDGRVVQWIRVEDGAS